MNKNKVACRMKYVRVRFPRQTRESGSRARSKAKYKVAHAAGGARSISCIKRQTAVAVAVARRNVRESESGSRGSQASPRA